MKLLNYALDLLFPSFCSVCGSFLFGSHRFVACQDCWEAHFQPYRGRKCLLCGYPLDYCRKGEGPFCFRCSSLKEGFHFDGVNYFSLYEGLVEEAIRGLKFDRMKPLSEFIARSVKSHFESYLSEVGAEVVVPVPLHPKTLKERGFNQTEEVLKAVGVEWTQLLRKVGLRQKQSSLNRKERERNVKGLFEVVGPLPAKRLLVFDDVFTTGATANEISRLLKEAGAEEVFVYTLAYTPFRQATK